MTTSPNSNGSSDGKAGPAKRWAPPVKAKRGLTRQNAFKTIANLVISAPTLLVSMIRPKTSSALREKVMLGVTSVTDCGICQWGHSHWAMANGVSLDEVNQILSQENEALAARDPAEAAAILFAQHYAENLDQYDPEAIANLRRYYTEPQVNEILAYIRTITFGSLTGNSLHALLGYFRGDRSTGVP